MVRRVKLRAVLIISILAIAGWFMGDAAEKGDVVLFTVEGLFATALVTVIAAALGPVQKVDERMVARSKDAALIAVRASAVVGLIAGAYANMLGYTEAAVLFVGMVVPGIIWVVAYFTLNWRDVHG